MSEFGLLKNNNMSHLEFSKFQEYKALFSLSNQALWAYFSPYSALLACICGLVYSCLRNPQAVAYILFLSSHHSRMHCWYLLQSLFTAKVRTILIVATLTIGLNVSLKSTFGVCRNLFATSLALNLVMVPSGFSLTLYTHLFPTNL